MNEKPKGFGATISWGLGLYVKSLIDNAAKWTLAFVFGGIVIAGAAWYINNRIQAAIAPVTDFGTNTVNTITGAYTATKEVVGAGTQGVLGAAGELRDAGVAGATTILEHERVNAAVDAVQGAAVGAKELGGEAIGAAKELIGADPIGRAENAARGGVEAIGGAARNLITNLRGQGEVAPAEAPRPETAPVAP